MENKMICPICLKETTKENPPSRDHIIPKWLVRRLSVFTGSGKTWQSIKKAMGEPVVNVRIICRDCNTKKGGRLDFTDPATREVVVDIVENLSKQLTK